jgi:hypothetical protein
MMMRRTLLLAAAAGLAAGTAAPVIADTYPTGRDGCVATAPGQNVANPSGGAAGSGNVANAGKCSFTAVKSGGFTAVGTNWKITVYDRADPATRKVQAVYTTASRQTHLRVSPLPGAPVATPTPCLYPAYSRGQFVVVETADGVVTAGSNAAPAISVPDVNPGQVPPVQPGEGVFKLDCKQFSG